MDQNQQQNIYPDLYKKTLPEKSENEIDQAPKKKKMYWLRGLSVGLLAYIPFFFAAFYVWNTLSNFYYPHHGSEISFIRPMAEAFQLIVFGLPIFIISGIVFGLVAKDRLKRFLLIGGIAIAAIFLLGAAVYAINLNLPQTRKAFEHCKGLPEHPGALYSRSDQFYNYNFCDIIAKWGSAICNRGEDDFQATCMSYAAVIQGDPNLCQKNKYSNTYEEINYDFKLSCREFFVANNNDLAACEKFDDKTWKESCVAEFARKNKDISVCDNLNDIDSKNKCYTHLTEFGGISDEIVCEKITDSIKKDSCYYNLAVNSLNPSICKNISDIREKVSCYEFKYKLEELNKEGCNKYKNEERDICYILAAGKGGDFNLCTLLDSQSEQKECFYRSSIKIVDTNIYKTSDYDSCRKITDSQESLKCSHEITTKAQKLDFCNTLSNDNKVRSRDICFWAVAERSRYGFVCGNITDILIKDNCYLSMAIRNGEPADCYNIKGPLINEVSNCVSKARAVPR